MRGRVRGVTGSEPIVYRLRIFACSRFDEFPQNSGKIPTHLRVIVYMCHSMVPALLSPILVCPPRRRPRDVELYAHAHAILDSSHPQIHGSSRFMNYSCMFPSSTQIIYP